MPSDFLLFFLIQSTVDKFFHSFLLGCVYVGATINDKSSDNSEAKKMLLLFYMQVFILEQRVDKRERAEQR